MTKKQTYSIEKENGLKAIPQSNDNSPSDLIRDGVNNAAGMWSDRKDLPYFESNRKSLDRD